MLSVHFVDIRVFSPLYSTLSHQLITDKVLDATERTFKQEDSFYLFGSGRLRFVTVAIPGICIFLMFARKTCVFHFSSSKQYTIWFCKNVSNALSNVLDNYYS